MFVFKRHGQCIDDRLVQRQCIDDPDSECLVYIYKHAGITSCYCRGAPYFVSNVPVRVNVLQVEDNCNCASTNEYLYTKECSRGSLVQFTLLLSFGTNNWNNEPIFSKHTKERPRLHAAIIHQSNSK